MKNMYYLIYIFKINVKWDEKYDVRATGLELYKLLSSRKVKNNILNKYKNMSKVFVSI